MKKNKRAFRWTCLGVLCAGLVLVGVGGGMGLAEAATFTYAGVVVLQQVAERSQTLTVRLRADGGQVYLDSYASGLSQQLRDVARIVTSEDVQPNSIRLDLRYDSAGMEVYAWNDHADGKGTDQWVHLAWEYEHEWEMLLACKDQILSDIKDHQIGDYILGKLTGAVITVNPADAERVTIG